MLSLRFNLLQRWMFVVFFTKEWIFTLTRLVRVDVFVHRKRWVCESIFVATPFARCHFALWRLMLPLNSYSLDFDGVLFFSYTGVRVVRTCGCCPFD